MKSKTTAMLLSIVVLIAGWNTVTFSQQGSGSSRTDPQRATRPQTPEEFYSSFWSFIVKKDAAYNTWNVIKPESLAEGVENPHSTISKTYASKSAADDPKEFPMGSILIREDYDANRKRQSISVMYRIKDYDKDHGNWYWIKYLENGTVARGTDNKAIAGKVTTCIECHGKARGKDFVFSNDLAEGKPEPKPSEKSDSAAKPKE
ncbi:MAG: cytochrome P460 family protein [Bdellovibrionales bacterium]|nr:cytochrome P460 family protein [Bdellovibrionales bacterium]